MRHELNIFMFMFKTKTWFDVVEVVVKNRNTYVNFYVKQTLNKLFALKGEAIKKVYKTLVQVKIKKLITSKSKESLRIWDKVRLSLKKEKKTLICKETAKPT